MADKPETIDAYLAQVDAEKRDALQALREAVQAIVPEAVEGFSYGMPALRVNGRPLIAFAAAKNHCSLYPMSPAVIEQYQVELADFETSKGTIRFSPERPIPADLLRKLVAARLAEIQ